MGYFPVRYDSRVVNYDCRGFIRLATDGKIKVFNFDHLQQSSFADQSFLANVGSKFCQTLNQPFKKCQTLIKLCKSSQKFAKSGHTGCPKNKFFGGCNSSMVLSSHTIMQATVSVTRKKSPINRQIWSHWPRFKCLAHHLRFQFIEILIGMRKG